MWGYPCLTPGCRFQRKRSQICGQNSIRWIKPEPGNMEEAVSAFLSSGQSWMRIIRNAECRTGRTGSNFGLPWTVQIYKCGFGLNEFWNNGWAAFRKSYVWPSVPVFMRRVLCVWKPASLWGAKATFASNIMLWKSNHRIKMFSGPVRSFCTREVWTTDYPTDYPKDSPGTYIVGKINGTTVYWCRKRQLEKNGKILKKDVKSGWLLGIPLVL